MIFVDTNYFFRYLLADLPEQHERVKQLFKQAAQGKVKLFTSTVVMFEIAWVAAGLYKKPKQEVITILEAILSLHFIFLAEKELLSASIAIFKQSSLSLADCYNLAYAKQNFSDSMATFDQPLAKKAKMFLKYPPRKPGMDAG